MTHKRGILVGLTALLSTVAGRLGVVPATFGDAPRSGYHLLKGVFGDGLAVGIIALVSARKSSRSFFSAATLSGCFPARLFCSPGCPSSPCSARGRTCYGRSASGREHASCVRAFPRDVEASTKLATNDDRSLYLDLRLRLDRMCCPQRADHATVDLNR